MNELTRCKKEWEKPIKSNSGTHNRPTMRKKSLILISRTMEGFMKEKAFELSLVGLVGSHKLIRSKIYPQLSKQYEPRPGDIKPDLWGEQLISWSKEYLKDVKTLGMRNGMKGNSEKPLSTGYSGCSKRPLDFLEKGNDTILPVLQKKKKLHRNDSCICSFFTPLPA